MSVEYYIRLERGNAKGVSEAVLEGISRALQLDDAEHAHLYDLVRAANEGAHPQRRRGVTRPQQVRPGVQQLLDAMTTCPCSCRTAGSTSSPSTPSATALFSEMYVQPQRPANFGRFVFLDHRAERSTATGTTPPSRPSRCSAPRPDAPRTTGSSATWSASSPPAATCSAPCGHPTTSASTGPASRASPTRSSATSIQYEAMDLSSDRGLLFIAYTADPGWSRSTGCSCSPVGPRPTIRSPARERRGCREGLPAVSPPGCVLVGMRAVWKGAVTFGLVMCPSSCTAPPRTTTCHCTRCTTRTADASAINASARSTARSRRLQEHRQGLRRR